MSLRAALAQRHSEAFAYGPGFQEAADLTDGLMPEDWRFDRALVALQAMDDAYRAGRAGKFLTALNQLKDALHKEPSHEQTTFAL